MPGRPPVTMILVTRRILRPWFVGFCGAYFITSSRRRGIKAKSRGRWDFWAVPRAQIPDSISPDFFGAYSFLVQICHMKNLQNQYDG